METQNDAQITKVILTETRPDASQAIRDFKAYYRTVTINITSYWLRIRHVGQWNTIETPETNLNICNQLIFNKIGKTNTWIRRVSSAYSFGSMGFPCVEHETRLQPCNLDKNQL